MKKMVLALLVVVLTACAPTPTGEAPVDGPLGGAVYIDSAELLIMESYPIQVILRVEGNLPTPCHEFRYQYEIQDFGEEKRLDVTTYTYNDPAAICAQVTQPFEENINFDLENAPEGKYVVYLNGDMIGEFSYPG